MTQTHKVFVSYHHSNDQHYRDLFETLFSNMHEVMVSKSVQLGDINPNLKTDTVRQKIRDGYLSDSTVTVVLIGSQTWQRRHVDWEIGASIRSTQYNPRSGLIGIFLPNHPAYNRDKYNRHTIPPRLFSNTERGYATLHDWNTNPVVVQSWIHNAFLRRTKIIPDNSYPTFANNRTGTGWS